MTPKVILDPCAGNDNLTQFYPNADIIRYEIKEGRDFFESTQIDCDLVVCNPHFNGAEGRKLFPEEFLRHIIMVVPPQIPIVFITPPGFRLNVRGTSARLAFLKTLNITSVITLPLDVFEGVLFHTEVLILNQPRLKSHDKYSPNDVLESHHINLSGLYNKLNRFIGITPSLTHVCQLLSHAHGLQNIAGHVLASLFFNTDELGFIASNQAVREEASYHINSSPQVVMTQLKALSDMNLLTKVTRGYYFCEAFSPDQCRKIWQGEFSHASIELSYLDTQLLPAYDITVE
ncbi:MAG: SAM-dependent methyltransferase [Pseudomonadota bacterium]|nr:SAM-dependent methyltransferase [Pseudomonadota bacterium]MDO7711461.1 SAM-dependent methyltransferase [Pseudomonadota bacterium]